MGEQIKRWTQRINRIRLSQILDMYYSARGIGMRASEIRRKRLEDDEDSSYISIYDAISRACDRIKILRAIDIQKLKDETYNLAQILQFAASGVTVNDDMLKTHCDAAVDRFFDYAGKDCLLCT